MDQPWLLVNRDPLIPGQDNIYSAYDDSAPYGSSPGSARVSVALVGAPGTLPLSFTRDNPVGGENGPGNAGLRLAVDPLSGDVYAMWQQPSSPFTNPDGSIHNSYRLNRSTDGGQTWGLNGSPSGIEVAQRSSDQPSFGGVNALLGGLHHAAVDPNSGDVYCVFGDRDGGAAPQSNRLGIIRLHDDGTGTLLLDPEVYVGTTGSGNVQTALPSVAVSSNGVVGVMYDSFDGFTSTGIPIFTAHFAKSADKGVTWTDEVLLTFLATSKPASGLRILGDYQQVKSVGRYFYGAFTGNSAALGALGTGTMGPVFFKSFAGGPLIQVNSTSLNYGPVCLGATGDRTLQVFNTGTSDLHVVSITRISGSTDFALLPTPTTPTTISQGSEVDYTIRFTPTASGAETATFRITSDDPDTTTIDVVVSGTGTVANFVLSIADNGNFGNVCVGSFRDEDLTINNSGGCDLTITSITSSDPIQFQPPIVTTFPLVVHAGGLGHVTVRFAPALPFGAKSGMFTVNTSVGNISLVVKGNAPSGTISVTGQTDLGGVCANTQQTTTLSVCNVGSCDLHVSSAAFSPACADFTIVNNPFPTTLSQNFCLPLTIQFTPTSCGPKSCTLVISSDDPLSPTVTLTVTANTPCASIDVPPDVCFPPTVIQSVGACTSANLFPISNKGSCPISITSITTTGPYSLTGLPSFPINLQPGQIAGGGNLSIVFAPTVLSRDTLGSISVTYETDPVTHATTTVTRTLNGEGVRTGARVLVVNSKTLVPVPLVSKLMIQRITGNRNKPLLNTVGNAMNLAPVTVTPAAPCVPFTYHQEYSTVSNPIQLLPGSYQVTATATVNGKKASKTVGFSVVTCTFNPNIVISLP